MQLALTWHKQVIYNVTLLACLVGGHSLPRHSCGGARAWRVQFLTSHLSINSTEKAVTSVRCGKLNSFRFFYDVATICVVVNCGGKPNTPPCMLLKSALPYLGSAIKQYVKNRWWLKLSLVLTVPSPSIFVVALTRRPVQLLLHFCACIWVAGQGDGCYYFPGSCNMSVSPLDPALLSQVLTPSTIAGEAAAVTKLSFSRTVLLLIFIKRCYQNNLPLRQWNDSLGNTLQYTTSCPERKTIWLLGTEIKEEER
jgi:hypothetical protein